MSSNLDELLGDIREAMRPFWEERQKIEDEELPKRSDALAELGINIETSGGNCPVQIEGTVEGQPFYFRARGSHWSLGIGGEPVLSPDWGCEADYGSWPDAGWMHLHEAFDFLIGGVRQWKVECLPAAALAAIDEQGE